jgi:D-3-phosphoglycerate dehydrogenase
MLKVVISDHNFASVGLQRTLVESRGIEFIELRPGAHTEDEVIERCAEANALLVQRAPITRRVLHSLTALRGVVRYGIGVDEIDLEAAKELGIGVANVPTYCLEEVSNHAAAMIISLARRIPEEHHRIVHGGWRIDTNWPDATSDMTLGLVGFGGIARRVARKALAFGFRVVAADPFIEEATLLEHGAEKVELSDLFASSDIISLHCPLLPTTRHLIQRANILKMKRGVVIVNTSRGALIKEEDLVVALQDRQVSSAGLDVFEQEPLVADSLLRQLPNVLLTGHSASYSARSLEMLQTKAAEAALDFLEGRRPEGQIVAATSRESIIE